MSEVENSATVWAGGLAPDTDGAPLSAIGLVAEPIDPPGPAQATRPADPITIAARPKHFIQLTRIATPDWLLIGIRRPTDGDRRRFSFNQLTPATLNRAKYPVRSPVFIRLQEADRPTLKRHELDTLTKHS